MLVLLMVAAITATETSMRQENIRARYSNYKYDDEEDDPHTCVETHSRSYTRNENSDPYSYYSESKSRRLGSDDAVFSSTGLPPGLGYGRNYYAPQIITSYNEYWNADKGETKYELYDYFRPENFYQAGGYYSPYYR